MMAIVTSGSLTGKINGWPFTCPGAGCWLVPRVVAFGITELGYATWPMNGERA